MTSFGTEFITLKEKYKKILRNNCWYHGTTLDSLNNLKLKGPLVNHNIGKELDFGHGFYLAPDLEMAKRYTETMIGYMKEMGNQFPFTEDELTPIVIEYELIDPIAESFFIAPDVKTTCFPSYSEDFALFILENRLNPQKKMHDYDLIYGVMSDSNPNILVPQFKGKLITKEQFVDEITKKTTSTRQLSVHNQVICDKLVMKAVHYVKEGVVKHVEYISHGQR
ncbi:DUF3990 domain-containing protein [Sporosarcina sp. D27]|uniref:DUF3990 domain-containing protein n=1 Tax=Sporosarcina sp. D27 TaxID=1382305 RepID=UPI000471A041|nr:DUF3990 domain-containing protein [Sporosarcina sp. D27]